MTKDQNLLVMSSENPKLKKNMGNYPIQEHQGIQLPMQYCNGFTRLQVTKEGQIYLYKRGLPMVGNFSGSSTHN